MANGGRIVDVSPQGKEKESKSNGKGKVDYVKVEKSKNGKFIYEVCRMGENMMSPAQYAYDNLDEVKEAMEKDFGAEKESEGEKSE